MVRYRGSYHIRIDNRRRVTVPRRLRQSLKDRSDTAELAAVIIRNDTSPHITFYDQTALDDIDLKIDAFPRGSTDRLALEDLFFSDAQLLETDKSGRVILPENLLSPIGLGANTNAIFLAEGESFSLYNPDHLTKLKADISTPIRP